MAWLANHATIDMHPWTSTTDDYRTPTYALIDIDPGTKTTWDEVLTLARLYRAALEHLKVKAWPKVTGKRGIQIWVPVKHDLHVSSRRSAGSRRFRARSARRCPELGQLGVGQVVAQRQGAPRLHPERGQQDARRAVRRATRRQRRRSRRRSTGTSSTIRTCARTAGTSRRSSIASWSGEICSRQCSKSEQELPAVD